ncbi:archaemetzincin-1 isoform X2 [Heterocephalus glaber]|uniref:Archaemetzincin-1 isoform X2 n=1 Tax=Heterocephalus glaber TaxID=10181 RepID=A0AAX6SNR4_HETGA|nr:archaemetzincin-1 isoform X2 [Heterocephalus glaber]
MLPCRPAQEFSFGPRMLRDALVSSDTGLQQCYTGAFSLAERLFLAEAYNPHRTLFHPLLIYSAFDWLLSRPEAPEDFASFHAALPHRTQSLPRKHIYLQPIDLSEAPVGFPLLDYLRSCAEAFFLGLRVKCLPSVAAESISCSSRPRRDSDGLQLNTDGILSFLKNNKPDDALCVLGLTLSDLYPCEAWSFTFSTFLPGHKVGICSFARFVGELPQAGSSAPYPAPLEAAVDGSERLTQDSGQRLCFSALGVVQCCKVTCHELCHLLGLGNCRWLRCLMQGALSLEEVLRWPLDLCPICLRKLQHVLGFQLLDRYKPWSFRTLGRLHTWTQAVVGTWPSLEAGEPSVSETTLPVSADSGMCCESDSEPGTSLSEPGTPDAWSRTFPEGPEDELSSLAAAEVLPRLGGPVEAMEEHGRWLATCIEALEREVAEEELAQVDRAVDALEPWEMFTGRLPAIRQDRPCSRDSAGLRKVLGDKLSSLRRRLGMRRLSKVDSSPCHWDGQEK